MTGPPRIAVVIPSYGPAPHLDAGLQALRAEVGDGVGGGVPVVVSHSGPDAPEAAVAAHPGVRLVRSDARLYAGAARNAGAEALPDGAADWIAFLDSDVEGRPGWAAALRDAIAAAYGETALIGAIGCAPGSGYWGRVLWWIESGSVQPSRPAHAPESGPGANVALPAALFHALGGFAGGMAGGEDGDLFARVRARPGTLRFVPDMAADHHFGRGWPHARAKLTVLGRDAARLRAAQGHLPGGAAVRRPWLAPALLPVRIAQMARRVLTARPGHRAGALADFLCHLPGIVAGLAVWTRAFGAEARRIRRGR